MPLNPSIALGVRPIEIPNQLAQYAQVAQIEGAQRQNEVARMQLEQLQQDRTEMQAFQKHLADNGGNPDLKQFAAMLLKSPKHYDKGVEMLQKLQEQDKFDAYLKRTQPAAAPAAPGMLGSGTAGIMPAGPGIPAPAVNALAPTPGSMLAAAPVPVNALAAQPTLADLEANYRAVSGINTLGAKAEAEMIKDQIKTMRTPQVVGAGSTVLVGGKPSYTAPPTETELQKNFKFAKTLEGGNYKGTFDQFKAISTPKTTINMSTERKYGEQLAGKIADSDSNKLGAAEKAPQLAESANRIIDLVSQGNLFTGPIADVKLNIARALNVVGANNNEKIANTEALIAATGQSTLDAIKGAGLGTGQGFTDKDLKFLQGIAGGAITYTPQTLTELATLQHRVATRSVENWNRRFKEIPKSATEGLGISAAPNVPPLSSGAIFAVNPTTGARIQSTDGGNTWKPAGAK